MNEELKYTGFWLRFVSQIIDVFLLLIITVPIILLPILFFIGSGNFDYNSGNFNYSSLIYGDLFYYLDESSIFTIYTQYIMPFLITMVFWTFFKATPGKMSFRMVIVDAETGEKPSFLQYLTRYLAYIPSILVLGLGILWIAFDKRKQGWHDKLAGTVVVRQLNYEVTFNKDKK